MKELDYFFFEVYQHVEPYFSLQPQEVRFLVLLFLSVILGIFFGFWSRPWIRKFFALALGLTLQFLMFKADMLFTLGFVLLSYSFLYTSPGQALFNTFAASLLSLIMQHSYNYYNEDFEPLGIQILLMSSCLKSISIAVNRYNSTRRSEILSGEKLQKVLFTRPRLFDYLAYQYFFPTCFWGPFIEYDDFLAFISKKGKFAQGPSFGRRFLMGCALVLCTVPIFAIITFFGFELMVQRNGHTVIMSEYNLPLRVGFYNLSAFVDRLKNYYLSFLLTQAALIMAGISLKQYDSENGKKKIQHHESISVSSVFTELKFDPKEFLQNFNPSLTLFIKEYVYGPLTHNKYSRSESLAVTLFFVAIWLGPHPVVITCLIIGYLYIEAYQKLSRLDLPLWNSLPVPLRVAISSIGHFIILNGLYICCRVLSYKLILNFLESVYYIPIVFPVFICLTALLLRNRKSKVAKIEKKEIVEISDETGDYLISERKAWEEKRYAAIQKYIAEKEKKSQ